MPAMAELPKLGAALHEAWRTGHSVYLCGNGGSAGNAIHLANDLLYGAGLRNGGGLKVEALSANPAVLTCLANDVGYAHIFAEQLKVKANAGDVLIVLSGSGNSENVVKALEVGNAKGMTTFAVLGYSGGRCKAIAQHAIHFADRRYASRRGSAAHCRAYLHAVASCQPGRRGRDAARSGRSALVIRFVSANASLCDRSRGLHRQPTGRSPA